MEYKIGNKVKYNGNEYTIDNVIHNIDSENHKLYLKNDKEDIEVIAENENIEYLNDVDRNMICNNDRVIYEGKEYTVHFKTKDPFDSSKYWFGLYDEKTKEIVKVKSVDLNKVKKILIEGE